MKTIKVKMSGDLIEEFQLCEEGAKDSPDHNPPYAYDILGRWKSQIEIRTEKELREIWWALCSGTFKVHHTRAAANLGNKLKPHVKEVAEHNDKMRKTLELNRFPEYSSPSNW